MKKIDLIISNDAPNVKDAAWLKPTKGGFALKVMDGGIWKDLVIKKEEDSQINAETLDKLKAELIGSVQDEKTANTINGAKTLAKEIQKKVDILTKQLKETD